MEVVVRVVVGPRRSDGARKVVSERGTPSCDGAVAAVRSGASCRDADSRVSAAPRGYTTPVVDGGSPAADRLELVVGVDGDAEDDHF